MKKTTKSCLLAALTAVWSVATWAEVGVTNIAVKQHWPWNGLVDIDYEIVSDDAEATFLVYPKAEDRRLKWLPKLCRNGG